MSESSKISIIMPVYNAERFLKESIGSIQNQSYKNWELLAVDDCSSDGSRALLEDLAAQDSRIRPIFLEKNSGAAAARNAGIAVASGQFLAFLDSDDRWAKDKLKIQLQFMKKHGYAFTFTSYQLMDVSGKLTGQHVSAVKRLNYRDALTKTVIWTSTVMLDLDQTGTFEMPNLRAAQDTATWLKLLKKIPYAYGLDQELSYYRQVPGSISHSWKRRLKRQWAVYRQVEQFSLLKSMYLYVKYVNYVLHKRKKS